MFNFNLQTLFKISYAYLALPLFIFICSWLNYFCAIPLAILFSVALYKIYRGNSIASLEWKLDGKTITAFIVLASIWCFFAGIGYFYYQSFDYHFRNAVFRDLLTYDWPVFYDKANTPMVYYMGFWLVPALLGKLSALFVHSAYWNFYIANIFLIVYAISGTILIFAHLSLALKSVSFKKSIAIALLFILFSGLDIIGILFFRTQAQPFVFHLDWWATFMQYSSFSTAMFWVFNQFIPIALITLLVFNERNIQNFGFLIVFALFFSPYPTASLGIFMLAYTFLQFITSQQKKAFILTQIFSIPNIIGVFWLLPVCSLYFITNSEGIDRLWYIFDQTSPWRLLIFLLLEFLLYALIITPSYKKHLFFVTSVVLLCLIPFFRLDQQNNFCMRASLPPLIILSVYIFRFIFEKGQNTWAKALLLLLLIIGTATPAFEFFRGLYFVQKHHQLNLVADEIYTLNQKIVTMPVFGWSANHQFTAKDYQTDIFWNYLAK